MFIATADLCDLYGDGAQIAKPIFQAYGGVEYCFGQIRTIRLDEDNRCLVEMLRDEKGEGSVAVVDAKGVHCAIVGDRLMGFARENGWAGIVVNGYVRDTRETRNIPVGLWALGAYPLRSSKKSSCERDVDLEFAGVVFRPGEYLYADHDGIVVTPRNAVEILRSGESGQETFSKN
jgi:regulator of ribonuclease activity A